MIRKTSGFTLIELMVVVAIIGVLAAIAIPLFQGNVMKTQMNRAVSELAGYRTTFEERISNGLPVTNEDLGYVRSTITSDAPVIEVATVNSDGSGHLEVTLGGDAHPNLAGTIVRHVREPDGRWICQLDVSGASNWKASYLPGGCSIL